MRVGGAGDLAADHLRGAEQHADIEDRVDARLRRDEVGGREPPGRGYDQGGGGARGPDRPDGPRPERVPVGHVDHRERGADEQRGEQQQGPARQPGIRRHDQEQGAPQRRTHVARRRDHRPADPAGLAMTVRQSAGVAIDQHVIEAGAGQDHRQAVRQLVQPGREQLERVQQHAAERQVPQEQRGQEGERQRA